MTWNPDEMSYGEMERAQAEADLCRSCAHREVCPVPAELGRRAGWFLSVGTCGHYEDEEEKFLIERVVAASEDPDAPLAVFSEAIETERAFSRCLWALEFAVGWAMVADAHARTEADAATVARKCGLIDEERYAMAQHAARFATRELAAARRALDKAEHGE